jgi:hypothetical protein
LTAEELWAAYAKDNVAAGKKYDEQYLEVSGKVKKVLNTKAAVGFVLATSHSSLGVECLLLQREDLEGVKEGDVIAVQGVGGVRAKIDQNVQLGQCKLKPK